MFKKNVSVSEPVFRSKEVARMFGVSLRMLQWWDERGVIHPMHKGHARLYTRDDAVLVGVVSELRRKGCSLQAVRKVLRKIQHAIMKPDGLEALAMVSPLGKHCVIADEYTLIIDALKDAAGPMHVVSISDQTAKMRAFAFSGRNGKDKSARR